MFLQSDGMVVWNVWVVLFMRGLLGRAFAVRG